MKRTLGGLAIIAAILIWVPAAFGFDLTVVSYNVESDADTDPAKVVQDLQRIDASHLWALVEVDTPDLETYRAAIGQNFTLIDGNTGIRSGPDDRLAIVFDPTVLEKIGQTEELSAAGGSCCQDTRPLLPAKLSQLSRRRCARAAELPSTSLRPVNRISGDNQQCGPSV